MSFDEAIKQLKTTLKAMGVENALRTTNVDKECNDYDNVSDEQILCATWNIVDTLEGFPITKLISKRDQIAHWGSYLSVHEKPIKDVHFYILTKALAQLLDEIKEKIDHHKKWIPDFILSKTKSIQDTIIALKTLVEQYLHQTLKTEAFSLLQDHFGFQLQLPEIINTTSIPWTLEITFNENPTSEETVKEAITLVKHHLDQLKRIQRHHITSALLKNRDYPTEYKTEIIEHVYEQLHAMTKNFEILYAQEHQKEAKHQQKHAQDYESRLAALMLEKQDLQHKIVQYQAILARALAGNYDLDAAPSDPLEQKFATAWSKMNDKKRSLIRAKSTLEKIMSRSDEIAEDDIRALPLCSDDEKVQLGNLIAHPTTTVVSTEKKSKLWVKNLFAKKSAPEETVSTNIVPILLKRIDDDILFCNAWNEHLLEEIPAYVNFTQADAIAISFMEYKKHVQQLKEDLRNSSFALLQNEIDIWRTTAELKLAEAESFNINNDEHDHWNLEEFNAAYQKLQWTEKNKHSFSLEEISEKIYTFKDPTKQEQAQLQQQLDAITAIKTQFDAHTRQVQERYDAEKSKLKDILSPIQSFSLFLDQKSLTDIQGISHQLSETTTRFEFLSDCLDPGIAALANQQKKLQEDIKKAYIVVKIAEIRKTYFDPNTGIFPCYLKERHETFFFRDVFSAILEALFGWCGYVSEQTKRETYINLLNTTVNEQNYSRSAEEIGNRLQKFSPRTQNNECSLQSKLGMFSSALKNLEQDTQEEFSSTPQPQ